LDTVQKIWAPLRKLLAPPGVPSWLRAWSALRSFHFLDHEISIAIPNRKLTVCTETNVPDLHPSMKRNPARHFRRNQKSLWAVMMLQQVSQQFTSKEVTVGSIQGTCKNCYLSMWS